MIVYLKQALILFFVAVLVFALHFFLLKSFDGIQNLDDLHFPLYEIYVFQLILSIIIMAGVRYFSQQFPPYVGFIFLGLLTLKFVLNYLYIHSGLAKPHADILKYNYLIVVVLFLFYDVGFAYKALNKS
ncbi:hypothetical protein [Sphingobacterium sp. 2149]|uniref:hypothetical protein n=1 Tax=Sphingobacterium sp. 2149 TaxID=2817763 RepID=UPI001AE4F967|nr:hypothetical protein [Sphingobacterium sp. 2149]MDR6737558.1 hypothetical protein [Sphingobacterium sp. 2149]